MSNLLIAILFAWNIALSSIVIALKKITDNQEELLYVLRGDINDLKFPKHINARCCLEPVDENDD